LKIIENSRQRLGGFTLIELLVVIGIIAVLAVTLLVAINPAEAQKKARDAQRLKDMATIQAIVEQWLNDNPGANLSNRDSGTGTNKACASSWLGVNICAYANVMPVDPSSRTASQVATRTATTTAATRYYLRYSNGAYKICTRLESTSNSRKLADDGVNNDIFEVYSNSAIRCP